MSEEERLITNKIEGTDKQRDDNNHKINNLRWTIIYVMYFTMFVQIVSYSSTFGSLWQYLKRMNQDVTEIFLGWTTTSRSIAALSASVVCGFWIDKRSWIEPLFVTSAFFFVGNILYIVAESFGPAGIWIVFISQLFLGFSGGVYTISRTLVSHYSYSNEVSKTMAYLGLFETIGFMTGPAIQAIGLFFAGNLTSYANYHIDLYTAPAYFVLVLGLVNFGLCIRMFYKDLGKTKIQHSEMNNSLPESNSGISIDKFAVAAMLLIFFIVMAQLVFGDVMFSLILMEVMGWGKQTSVKYGSFIMIGNALLSIVVFLVISPLTKHINDKPLLLIGLVLYLVADVIHFPFGPGKLELRLPDVRNSNGTIIHLQDGGCPFEYEWCHNTQKLAIPQLIVGTIGIAIPASLSMALVSIIYSKIIGPYQQGVYMGLFSGVGALSRAVSPFYISYVYRYLGMRATVYVSGGLALLAVILFLIIWNRVIPINRLEK